MTTMTQPFARFADTRHHPATTCILVALFWLAAAVLVATAHIDLDSRSAAGGAVLTIAAIVGSAYGYTRFCARTAGIAHALAVGIAWLAMAIVIEVAVS